MIGLDRLMKTPGVIAAGQFDDAGQIIRKAGEFPEDALERIAQLTSRHNKEAAELAGELGILTGAEWSPLNGWAVWGGKYAMCVMHNTGVIVEAKRADFNQLMVDLFLPDPTGPKPMYWESKPESD